MDFLREFFQQSFMQRALLASLLVSVACGVMGTFVVTRRNSYMVGAVSHSLLGGIGLSLLVQSLGWGALGFFTPICGALLVAVLVAFIYTYFSFRRTRSDTILSAIWTSGVALGLFCIAATPGYSQDLNSYLFGDILLISRGDLWFMLALDLCILPLTWLFYSRFLALCFNPELLKLRGLSIYRVSLVLNVMTALAVVLLSQAVGIVMVMALMVLPPATSSRMFRTIPRIMAGSGVLCLVASVVGMAVSYKGNWPTGASIILTATLLFVAVSLLKNVMGWFRFEVISKLARQWHSMAPKGEQSD